MDEFTITPKQQAALDWLRRELLHHHGLGRIGRAHEYEYKRWDVRPVGHKLSLVAEIGRIGDEGTYAQLLARDRRHILIGVRGGLQLLNAKNKARARGRRVVWELTDY